ncbi:MAG: pentapeptide repeat-containing protein [Pseudomonadota bacterium]
MADFPPEVTRINALTANARATWFVLLGVLSFVGVTLLSVEHIDFYGVDRATQLPLVNVEIPTRFFFYAAPPLVAAVFGYFHLYLIRLWDALSVAQPHVEDTGWRLGDVITPWLVSDAFLYLRNWAREDDCCTHRPLEGTAMVLNFLLAWVFGLLILFFLWWLSMSARNLWMAGLSGGSFFAGLLVGSASLYIAQWRAREPSDGKKVYFNQTRRATFIILCVVVIMGSVSLLRTKGPAKYLAPIDMAGADVFKRPEGWLPFVLARDEYRDAWCQRKDIVPCDDMSESDAAVFGEDWSARRSIQLANILRPAWSKEDEGPDFRGAGLRQSFLAGAELPFGEMQGAVLNLAQMERANLSFAKLTNASLFGAQLEGANLFSAQLDNVNLEGAKLFDANLSFSIIWGRKDDPISLKGTNLSAAKNNGGAIRFSDLSGVVWDEKTDFRSAFLDATVTLPSGFYERMDKPCQWLVGETLSESEFFSLWNWWLGRSDANFLAGLFPSIAVTFVSQGSPTPERLEELGLTDCEPGQPFGPMPTGN